MQPNVPTDGSDRAAGAAWRSWTAHLDLFGSCALLALAALAYGTMPDGSGLRVALALSILFFVPGHLLIEAALGPAASNRQRAVRACVALGVSPALVGLLALATAFLPGGFHGTGIVATVTATGAACAAIASWRRLCTNVPDVRAQAVAA